jgi:hypothetical protein
MSRPIQGHDIVNLATGESPELDAPERYARPTIEDWSPSSDAVLCDWRTIDPNNDGSWIAQIEAITWFGGKSKPLGSGRDARFARDGKHVLYLTGLFDETGDLIWRPLSGKARRIAKQVTQFAIRRSPQPLKSARF